MLSIIFRWAVWGESADVDVMLSHSIATFRRFFGEGHRYVVYCDNTERVERALRVPAEVRDVHENGACEFDDPICTWRKWRPACRLDPTTIEFYVDADMFLLDEPQEMWQFCSAPGRARFICTTEPFGVGYYGNFADRIDACLPLINAGLIGQHAGADLTAGLRAEFDWWCRHVARREADYHDEQGAVRAALEPALQSGEVALLPTHRYRVVCPLNDPPVHSVEGLVLLHATFPHRPAFWQFYREICAVSGLA